jgi:hypothetical protein
MFPTNEAAFYCTKYLYNSDKNISRQTRKRFNEYNESEFMIFWSNSTFRYAARLTINYVGMKISPSIIDKEIFVRYLDITINTIQYPELLASFVFMTDLIDLKLKITGKDSGTVVDISKFPQTLITLELEVEEVYVHVEHKELKKFTINTLEEVDFNRCPSIMEFSCNVLKGGITCPRRKFKNFFIGRIDRDEKYFGDIGNILVDTISGTVVPRLETEYYTAVNFSSRGKAEVFVPIGENFYKKNPNATEMLIHSLHDILMEECVKHNRILKVISDFFPDFGFLDFFVNLQELEIDNMSTMLFEPLWSLAKESKLKITVCKGAFRCLPIFYQKGFEEIPKNLKIDVRDFFCPTDLNSLLGFVQNLGIDYFKVVSSAEFSQEWFQKFNFIKNEKTYYFTKKPHPGVIIRDQKKITLGGREFDKNCDHVEFFYIEDLQITEVSLANVFIDNSKITKFHKNKLKDLNITDSKFECLLEIPVSLDSLTMVLTENYRSQESVLIYPIHTPFYIKKMYVNRYYFTLPVDNEIKGDITLKKTKSSYGIGK